MESLKGRDHSEDLEVDGRIILNVSERNRVDVYWIYLAQGRGQLGAVVNTVMNI
jgi:hypothetical protein